MKIFDCTTYFEEDLMMDIRFNVLNEYVDKFIVCEANYSHSGLKKKINFDLNNFPKFKDKIIHLVVEDEPKDIINDNKSNTSVARSNSIKRINLQRNFIKNGLRDANEEDFIIYSDNDEIPDLSKVNIKNIKEKVIIFKQKIFYYKLNLLYPRIDWFGSKCCKLKNLKNITTLRETKPKKYNILRLDIYFSDLKHNSIKIINDGGWHFSNLKKPEDLLKKYLNDEMHSEFELRNIDLNEINRLVNEKKINYDHLANSSSNILDKQSNEFNLIETKVDLLPKYIIDNREKFNNWIV